MDKRSLLCAVSVFLFVIQVHAGQVLHGRDLCDKAFTQLKTAGFIPVRSMLVPSGQGNFPYNIRLDFPSGIKPDSSKTEDFRTNIVMVVSQQDLLDNSDIILPVLDSIKNGRYTFTITALFPAPGNEKLPGNEGLRGSRIYAAGIDEPDNTCAVVVRFSDNPVYKIVPGSGEYTAPDWLVRDLVSACAANKCQYDIIGGSFLSLYRFNILQEDATIISFLQNSISAAGITIPVITSENKEQTKATLTSFFNLYDPSKTANWDHHYSILRLGDREIWLNETFFVVCYLAVAAVSLFILCSFSFIAGKNTVKNWKDLGRTWYLVPATILMTAIALQFGQYIVFLISKRFILTPVLQFGIKLLISFLFVSILFIFEVFYKGEYMPFVYGYQLTVMSIINIFIFSALDLSFFFLFTGEYLAIYLTRPARRLVPLMLSALCIFLPFIPYCLVLLKYADPGKLEHMIYGRYVDNIFMACAVFPFFIMWLRFFSRLAGTRLQTVTIRTVLKVFFTVTATGILLCALFFMLSNILIKNHLLPVSTQEQKKTIITGGEDRTVQLSVADTAYLGITSRMLEIKSSKPAVRYIVSVTGENGLPVYDSVYPFTKTDTGNTVLFSLPDWPPQDLDLSWTSAPSVKSVITLTVFYERDTKSDNGYSFTRETYSLPGTASDLYGK